LRTGKALVVANADDADAGYIGDRLEQRGFALRALHRDRDEIRSAVTQGEVPDLILLLGSAWSVHAPVDLPALDAECALVRSAVASNVALLAICYGAQVVAHALGGSVSAAPRAEAGLIDIETDDPELVPPGPWTAFHSDVLRAPPSATVVARNGCGVQAFVLPRVLAVQFHPEVRPDVLDDWAGGDPELLADAGTNRSELFEQARSREDAARAAAHALVDAFLRRAQVAARDDSTAEDAQSGVT
jgi:GMP synthase-like glutamine amidotransferase